MILMNISSFTILQLIPRPFTTPITIPIPGICETRCPVVVEDATASDLIPREWTEAFHHKSYLAIPLIRQDAVIGVMALDYMERVTPFERWQVELAVAIASQLALTVENTRLYSEAQERLGEAATLLTVGQVLSQPAPAPEVMRRSSADNSPVTA